MKRIAILLVSVLAACGDPGPPNVPETVGACEGACIVFEHFECDVESENNNRELCMKRCQDTASLGYVWPDDHSGPRCIVKVKTLDELRACNVRCER